MGDIRQKIDAASIVMSAAYKRMEPLLEQERQLKDQLLTDALAFGIGIADSNGNRIAPSDFYTSPPDEGVGG